MRRFRHFLVGVLATVGALHVGMFVGNSVPDWVLSTPEARGMLVGLVVGMLISWMLEAMD